MAEFTDGQEVTYQAAVDMSSGFQFHAVAITADNKISPASHATLGALRAIGILQDKPKADEHGRVRIYGETKFAAAAAITQDQELAVAAGGAGWLNAITVASGTTRHILAIAKSDVASGGIGTATLQPNWRSAFT